MFPKGVFAAAIAVAAFALPGGAQAAARPLSGSVVVSGDVVVDWNRTMVNALLATATPPQPGTRIAAIVQTAVFDAVNGITRQYTQFRPEAIGVAAPRNATPTAAAVGAAYTALVALLPSQKGTFDAELAATLGRRGVVPAVARGLAWGQTVANAILTLRSTDGSTTLPGPYVVGPLPAWQPTLPLFAGPTFRQFATMTPWAMTSPSQFLPGPPPALTSRRYTQDFNEVKSLGSLTSLTRTPEQTLIAEFWAGKLDNVVTIWNRAADSLVVPERSVTENARLFALLNVAMADSVIAIWNAKNTYNTWRPITAIANAGTYDDTGASPDPSWRPLLPTPPFQEYPSGHSGVSAAAGAVLASFFGNDTSFSISSDGVPGAAITVRDYSSFSEAVAEVTVARIAAGFHFRFSCDTADQMGDAVAAYAMTTQMLPLDDHDDGQLGAGD